MAQEARIQPPNTRKRIFAITASASGNLVEWYDFYIYSFTSIYFASQFFPSNGDTVAELLKAAGVFFIGFLMRPIGGWLFGRIADRYGRKRSMLISIYMMCAGSFLIALLPTYETIGIAAAFLLLLVRMLQGLSVGGEYGTTATYMSEMGLKGRRGFFSSFQYVTLIGGQLLASFVVFLLTLSLSEPELKAWGWRIPFFIGGLAAIMALYLRRSLPESVAPQTQQNKEAGSVISLLRNHRKAFFLVVGFTAGGSLSFYTYTTYMQKYLITSAGFDKYTATTIMTAALFVFMLIQPLLGALADKIGTRTSLLLWSGLSTLATIPALHFIKNAGTIEIALIGVVGMMCVLAMYTSVAGIVKAEMFPASVRALGVGLAYAIANAIFGGSAETVALWLKDIGHEELFYYYVSGMVGLAFIAALFTPDARKSGYLQGDDIH
ncbi:MFS family transporter [Bartonella sp. DGB2]|uniref:MFS family transporter n=1 Tax=Bartonella sp. DGB2 TaxID=3388426 RepID=UPI00398FEF3D